ncbi:MAG: molybdate ABC transporter substrate-binding protein, partial [Acidimicrobiia bacterium]|nr:molybdate ABC transporter substrate-binding protein [Acidimicrobiia bacterium]
DVRVVLAASSSLAAQVGDGAPADVLATADPATMARAVASGEIDGTPMVFARNRAVIAVDGDLGAGGSAAEALDDARTLAVCAAEVPCGAASERLFELLGVEPTPDTFEPNVRSVLTKLTLGEVDVGVVYATDVLTVPDRLIVVPLAPDVEVATDYPIVTVDSDDADAAAFVDFIMSADGREILDGFGFLRP